MCAHALLSLFRSCREITNSSAKMIFDGSIELPTCITWQKYFDAITNRAVLLQVAPLHRSQDGGTYLRRSARKRERIFFRQLYIISVFVVWPYGCDTFDFILIFGFSRHKKWVSCYSVRNGGLIITRTVHVFVSHFYVYREVHQSRCISMNNQVALWVHRLGKQTTSSSLCLSQYKEKIQHTTKQGIC